MILENFKKASYYTLGCKLNFTETSTIKRYFLEQGIQLAEKGEKSDIVVVNTCSVTENAERKSYRLIRRIRNAYPDSLLIVTGCCVQLHRDGISMMEGVDLVFGLDEIRYLLHSICSGNIKSSFISKLKKFVPSFSYGDRTRGFLKVQDGCDFSCSYCMIPLARGKSRNGLILDLIQTAKEMLNKGVKEIVLTGINIGDFGKTTGESFLGLIRGLDTIKEEVRFRISSIEPNVLTDELVSFIAHSNHFTPHFHIPLQSGCDAVLKLMKRRYTTALFQKKIEMIKIKMPHAFIGLDVIVGMRGETEFHFEKTQRFLNDLPISQLHVFSYSDRPGTEALKIQALVPLKEKKMRSKQLLDLSAKKHKEFYNSQVGTYQRVLFEKASRNNKMYGFTDNYIRIVATYHLHRINRFIYGNLRFWNENKTILTIDL